MYLKLHLLPFADFPFASATMSNDDLESGRRLEHSESVLCIGLRSRRFLVLLVVASQLLLLVLWRSGHVASLYMKQVGHKEPFAPDSTRLSAPPRVSIPANAERHDMGEVIRHHGQTVEHPSSHFTMFDVKGGMFAWLKSRGEQFVQDIFHETLDVCREDMSPDEAWERAVVLDIGSNTGFYGLLALEKGCAVVFVEPQPECNALISWSIRESGLDERKVKRVQQPVGRKEDGAKSLAVRADNHCSGRFPIENAERGHKDAYGSDAGSADSQTALQIPFLPVPDMLTLVGLSDSSKIQLIKIDTEGNELQILEAMLPMLQHWQVSNMVVEVTPMWWRHTGYTTQSGAEIFEQLVNFGFVGSTIRGHSLKDAAAMRRYILHGKIYQDDLWLQKANASTSEEGFGSSNFSSTLEPLVVASTTPAALNSQKQLFVAPPQRIPANAERHDMGEVIRHHGQTVEHPSSHFTMFDVKGGMFAWLKSRGEQFVQDIFHETLDVCREDMSPDEAWERAVVLDIGSNTGFYGLLALEKGCAVVFVEPQPECNALISWSIRESGLDERKVKRVQQPVGRKEDGAKSLAVRADNHCSGRFPIENAERGHKDAYGSDAGSADSQTALQIPFLPVSDMLTLVGLSDSSKIQLIKIDTEGNELQILEAMLPILQHWQVSNMVVEVTPMWWRHTGYTTQSGAEIFEQLVNFGFVGSTIRGHSLKDAAAMRRYILHGKIYQDDLWLQKANASTSEEGFGSSNFSSTLEPLVVASTTPAALNSQKQLFVAPPQRIPANAERHDMGEVIRHHGQTFEHPSSHFTMFDVKGGMFAWLKSRGEQFVQDIFHETLDVCREDMSPDEAWERAVVLDIGSNTGFYGLLALEKGCAVVFVEPQPECNALISWSIRESGLDERKVKRVQQPVGRKEDGAKSLAVRADNHCSGRFPIENAERGHKDAYGSDAGSADSQTALQIPFLPVSDMLTLVGLSDSSKIQLIKLDTEGNELQILEAMLPILQHWQVSNMVVEVTPMWWRHTGYTTQSGAEIFEQLVNFGFVGSTIRGHSLKDAAAMRRYILHGKIYQDDLWLQKANASTSEEGFGSSNFSSTLEPLVVASTTPAALNSQKQLFVAPPQRIPANAERHDMGEVIHHHGQTVEHPSSHFTMFDVKGGMFAWLKSRGEQFVQDIFHETLDVCREDMSPDEAWERAVVLDIGSNTGFYGLLALEKGCAVVFVEPQPECNALISWSIRESGLDERKVKRVQQPVGRKEDGAKSLAVRADNHCSGRFPIENAERGHKDAYGSDAGSADSQTALQIPFLPVSDMLTLVGLSDSSKIQLIKLDTEGNELQILEAMLPILQHWQVSNMVVEVTPMWWRHTGYTTQSGAEIFEQLVNFGFVGSTIRGHSLKDAAAMRRYILHGKIYQDDLWLQRNKRVCTCTAAESVCLAGDKNNDVDNTS